MGDFRRRVAPLPRKWLFFLNLTVPVVATTLKNANASLVYSFLYKTVEVGTGLSLLAGLSVYLCSPPPHDMPIKAFSLLSPLD